jgi:hypothetical protein
MRFQMNTNWHKWFAWYPVKIRYGNVHAVVWLEIIETMKISGVPVYRTLNPYGEKDGN